MLDDVSLTLKISVTNISGTNLYQQQDRLWGGLGLGGSYNWDNDRYALFGEASVTTSLANFSDSLAVKGDIGLKINW